MLSKPDLVAGLPASPVLHQTWYIEHPLSEKLTRMYSSGAGNEAVSPIASKKLRSCNLSACSHAGVRGRSTLFPRHIGVGPPVSLVTHDIQHS
jgi:hypothetical protein